ncbi:RagB/SusD family nutrient uptake outer membrane protein [Flavobacteriaceae bacterium F08102]|nr:RagB/SusD family nutrient uptake outer membrane protein [Flavobacteriaceae bacterium F08102]
MKKIKYLYIVVIGSLMMQMTSCELSESLEDYKPKYALEAETAITNEKTAELALLGVYGAFLEKSSFDGPFPMLFIIPDIFSGYSMSGPFSISEPEVSGWNTNNPIASGTNVTKNIYSGLYDLINRANWVIEKVEQLDDNVFEIPVRKKEIIAEAKILRALGHFYLLRNFGQFYDLSSEYGINVRLQPVKSTTAQPRNTVAETYESILVDLDEAMVNAPDNRGKNYTNKTFAKALKARVLLYTGDYIGAVAMAKDVIDNSDLNFRLEPMYTDIFDEHDSPAIFTSSEILFGSSGSLKSRLGLGMQYTANVTVTQKYKDAIAGSMVVDGQTIYYDTSRSSLFKENFFYGGYFPTKYFSALTGSGDYEMFYHMRMAEVYLILAEASARANNSVTTEALEALNAIRIRAGATTTGNDGFETYPPTISFDQFLTAVRFEKLAELYAEGGESWYDLIRYDFSDEFGTGFEVSDERSTATNPDKFILPIPTESIHASGNVVKQNPSYE